MGEANQLRQIEQTTGALDGVRGAEDGIDRIRRGFATLGFEQMAFHVFEQIPAFGQESLHQLVHVHARVTIR